MTWITESGRGTRWVDVPVPKRRASPKGRRFAEVKVGDWLEGGYVASRDGLDWRGRKAAPLYSQVTDHWFDPVAGQTDPEKGMLFAVAVLRGLDKETAAPVFGHKITFTRFGLASQGYQYSSLADPLALFRAKHEALETGAVLPLVAPRRLPPC